MLYLLPTAVAGLLFYMFWMTGFRLRRDRIRFARQHLRTKFQRQRLRQIVAQSYALPTDRPEWQAMLSRLGGHER